MKKLAIALGALILGGLGILLGTSSVPLENPEYPDADSRPTPPEELRTAGF